MIPPEICTIPERFWRSLADFAVKCERGRIEVLLWVPYGAHVRGVASEMAFLGIE